MPGSERDAILEIVNDWMRQAYSDLAVARMIENKEIAPEILAFHAQQAAEKSLKALLILKQVEFPRTHIIGVLINLCGEAGYPVHDLPGEIVTLSRYAVTTRYPGEADPVSREDAKNAALLADQVFSWSTVLLTDQE